MGHVPLRWDGIGWYRMVIFHEYPLYTNPISGLVGHPHYVRFDKFDIPLYCHLGWLNDAKHSFSMLKPIIAPIRKSPVGGLVESHQVPIKFPIECH